MHYLAASLRANGRDFAGTRLVVTVGEDCEPFDIAARLPWTAHYPIEFRWLPRHLYQSFGFFGTMLHRYRYTYEAPLVLMMDADIVVARDFTELLEQTRKEPAFYSMLAHASPFHNSGLLHLHSDEEWWRSIFRAAGLGEPELNCQYTGYGYLGGEGFPRFGPPNFNQGVVIAPAYTIRSLGSDLYRELEHVNSVVETFYRFQIALTLALVRQRAPWRLLPMRYNFTPGFDAYIERLSDEWEQVRFIHYTRSRQFSKSLLDDDKAMEQWLANAPDGEPDATLRGIFEPLQRVVQEEDALREAMTTNA
ncbi:MAG: hypothetical protein ABSH09_25725 [Bryobacteraceae bacterium]